MALLTRESARARCEVAVDPSLVRSLGSSPASRLMACRADLSSGTSAERSSMHPSPTRAVTLAAQRGPARHHRRFRLELGGHRPEASFTHRNEELFRLRHCQVSDTQAGLVGLTKHSVRFAGNVHASHVPIRISTSCVSEKCLCNVDWESALGEGHEFLDEVCPLVQKDVEFVCLGFVVKGVSQSPVAEWLW